jgi:hypothetical protein
MASTICKRCNKGLKKPSSIEAEMGPACRRKAEAARLREQGQEQDNKEESKGA